MYFFKWGFYFLENSLNFFRLDVITPTKRQNTIQTLRMDSDSLKTPDIRIVETLVGPYLKKRNYTSTHLC